MRRWVRAGHFPRPLYLGPYGAPRWHPDDVVEYLRSSERRERRSRVPREDAGPVESGNDGRADILQEIPGTVSQGVVIPDAPLPEAVRVEIRVADSSPALKTQRTDYDQESIHGR
jgi:hypothetical protein